MSRSNGYNINLITDEDIQTLLAYVSYFESDDDFKDYAEIKDGGISHCFLEGQAKDFVEDCYEHHFVQDFDWPKWVDKHPALARKGEGVENADLATIGKMLTAHCRGDRFCEGHLLSVMKNGQVLKILKRLQQISQ